MTSSPLRLLGGEDVENGCFGIVGRHPLMLNLYASIRAAAQHQVPVVIQGPTGSGKELVARAIHGQSRASGRLICLNVAELSDQLLEPGLFGSERGAFTGAVARPGLIEEAHGGTLFLDEAGDLPHSAQAKLLRALEYHTIRRVGSTRDRHVRFRLILSTMTPVDCLVASRQWREDFRYRVDGFTVPVPALAQRTEDIPLLVDYFLKDLGHPELKLEQQNPLAGFAWPGNVRELLRVVERAVVHSGPRPVTVDDLVSAVIDKCSVAAEPLQDLSLKAAIRRHIEATMDRVGQDATAAARILGLSPSALYHRLRTYRTLDSPQVTTKTSSPVS
ncbi:MAG: sigma 54-interacting transcriptional regulator [Gemmatimonadales bacterium]